MRTRHSEIRIELQDEKMKTPMRLKTPILISAAVVVAALSAAGVVGYAQQPTQAQPMPLQQGTSAPAKKPAAAAKPQPHKQRPQEAQTPSAAAASVPPQQAGQQPTVFDEHARQGNVATCANLFGLLGRGLATNSNYTAQSQWDAKAGNSHSVQSLVALAPIQAPQGSAAQRAAGIVFAAPVGSSCEGNLVRVTPSAESCPTVAAELAKLNGQNGTLGDLATIALPNGAQVVLIPFGNACVAVTALRVAG
ncbi:MULTISPECIES: hypothetical protein [unclassified Bradyrhizobium]|uniref:hypothetical protein n=1 Tax=unclassified Bradyrhizobium TaxID=2631580 RepID=UPI001BAC1B98|nr:MULTISPECIES: hypothetical protein [unclassified Bradyrhizobium]MBR1203364.1 hypothetical protein [Bradyrhizobium sp. AUGA SZCCT0124]MBR1313027.1 hypothetical protein [Bradyrhizobium sp. AUGA SZCCT0051]MBR1341385.1 hypothetical protein [Bradyrhizobium sp. AUGA SZCCT0105]MBR1356677.1 hypothetical protein [Bradyrhizobium sp. AUGA SZCCT0045]